MNQDWTDWIDRVGDKDVSEEELMDFQQALRESPENIEAYLDALLTDTALETMDGLPRVARPVVTAAPMEKRSLADSGAGKWSAARGVMLALAACVALLLVLSFFLTRKQEPTQDAAAVATHVATITDSDKLADAAGLRIGKPLQKGEVVVPEGAEIGIAMRGGARLEINGPARLRIDGPETVFLLSGRVKTYAPEYAHGFSINTNEGEIVDLGTRFVTVSGTDAGTEIHVLEGLVKARPEINTKDLFYIGGEQAGILKDGKMYSTEYLARRLDIPMNPVLPDSDGDGVIDVVESHYGTDEKDPASTPSLLRIAEGFENYDAGKFENSPYRGMGKITQWSGAGVFQARGLHYGNNAKALLTSGGSLITTGEKGVGATIRLDSQELPPKGVIYISFLMKQPHKKLNRPFSGLLLYMGEYREQLFTGELSVADSYGSRYSESENEDAFAIPTDDQTHLFVIRIDQTRFLTDVFVDPPLAQPEADVKPNKRYQDAAQFDRIMVRSGSDSGSFPVQFDEIRVGLTWDAVLPLMP